MDEDLLADIEAEGWLQGYNDDYSDYLKKKNIEKYNAWIKGYIYGGIVNL